MSAIERKPLTAYQRRIRRELGHDDEEPTLDQQLARVEVDIRRLKVEFDIFFNGGVKHPPYDTRNRVETTLARLGDDRTLTYAQRYKFNSLSARFAAFRDLWRRSMQSREEGRDFITIARAKLDAMRREADAEIVARNAAKRSAIDTQAEAVRTVASAPIPPTSQLVQMPAPIPVESVPAVQSAANEEPIAPASAGEPAEELVKAVAPDDTDAAKAEAAEEVVQTDPEVKRPEFVAAETFPTDDLAPSDDQVTELTAELPKSFLAVEEPIASAPTPVESVSTEIRSPSTPNPEVVRGVKRNQSSFPKILPPSAHQATEADPPKRERWSDERRAEERRAGDRRSGDRRALPFGRRATDPKSLPVREAEAKPIVAPAGVELIRETAPLLGSVAPEVPPHIDASQPEPEAPKKLHVRSDSSSNVENEVFASFTFTDPRRETRQVKAVIAALAEAREKCGQPAEDLLLSRYGPMLASRADKIRKKGKGGRVVFTVVIENGKVDLKVTAGE